MSSAPPQRCASADGESSRRCAGCGGGSGGWAGNQQKGLADTGACSHLGHGDGIGLDVLDAQPARESGGAGVSSTQLAATHAPADNNQQQQQQQQQQAAAGAAAAGVAAASGSPPGELEVLQLLRRGLLLAHARELNLGKRGTRAGGRAGRHYGAEVLWKGGRAGGVWRGTQAERERGRQGAGCRHSGRAAAGHLQPRRGGSAGRPMQQRSQPPSSTSGSSPPHLGGVQGVGILQQPAGGHLAQGAAGGRARLRLENAQLRQGGQGGGKGG